MRRATELLPTMVQRYRGEPMHCDDMRIEDAREAPEPIREAHTVVDERIAGVDCSWINPENRAHGLIVSLHGGGYIVGPGAAHWGWFSTLCRETGQAGLLIRYSRAPEATYPTALNEVLGVVRTLDGPWQTVGDSAGGGLALALAFRLRDGGEPLPTAMVLSSPWLDLTMSNPGLIANAHADIMLGSERLGEYARAYAGDRDLRDPLVSPAFGDPAGLPPMLITAGGAELMRAEIRDWAAACEAAGTACEVIEVDGAIHDFAMARTLFPEAREVFPRMAAFAAGA